MKQVRNNLPHCDFQKTVVVALGLGLSATLFLPATALADEVPQTSVSQQLQNITGTVVDSSGEPLIGVNIRVDGTTRGTVTDLNGQYEIRAAKGQTMTFSYVGYKKATVIVNNPVINITLEDQNALDEVVVVGYGTVRKADLAGSVSVLEGKAFQAQPITEVSQAIQGRVAGVNLVSDGLPGGSTKIRIRGSNSINKSNEPLYVVDGLVRESGLDGINSEDIASMQILKDASSTAIYGSRGANGVVIITTKKGKIGESHLTFDSSVGFSKATRLPDVMGTKEYAQALVDYDGIPAADVQQYLDGTDPGIDWKDEVFRTGVVQNYKLVFTKGNEGMQLYVSGNYMRNEGILKKSLYERYAARVSVNADLFSWLGITADVNLSHGEGKGIGALELSAYNPIWVAFNSSPTMPMFTEDGVYARDPYCTIQDNAVGILTSPNERRNDIVNGHLDLRFKILPGLTFTTSNGIDYYNYYGYNQGLKIASPTAVSSMANNNTNRWLLQTTNNLTYVGTFNEVHNLTATAVWEATKSQTRRMGITGKNLSAESVGWWNVGNAAIRDASNSYSEWSLLSAVARVIYNYNNRYMLTGTFRADGSSRLTNNKWSYFPSIAAAWTISNEKFFEPWRDVVSNMKLRASWGIIGNQDIAPFSTLAMMSATTTYYGSTQGYTGYWAQQVGAPNLKWEKTKQFDIGLDVAFLNNRFDISLDYYYKRTSDALLLTSLADYLGGSSYYVNAGEVSNSGIDISLNANIIQSRDWNWTSSIQASYLKNKVEKMTAQQPILYSGSMQSVIFDACIVKEGEPIGALYGYRWAGIDQDGYDTYYAADGSTTRNPTSEDRVVLGKSNPTFTLGWNNTVTWKNWSLNAFFNGAFGQKRINALRFAMNSMIGNSRMFLDPDYISQIGVTMPNPTVDNNQYIGTSSKWVENANYFRCENFALGYDIPRSVSRFADIHLSFSIQNLFTITSYKGCNPASYSFSGDYEWAQGVDTGCSPAPRTYTIGARFTF